jgi:sulfur-carrier protein
MIVRLPTALRSYTDQIATVNADGSTLDEVLIDLDRQFPGIRFRVVDEQGRLRRHMRVYVNDEMARQLSTPVTDHDEITLMHALSGG